MEHLSLEEGTSANNDLRYRSSQPPEEMKTKRLNYLTWEDYFMANAMLSSMRSKDPNTQVGACIINEEMKIVGIGYNGMPKGCSDDELPWDRSHSDPLANKHLYVCHAEMNAIMNKNSSNVQGCTLYVTLFPCNECAKIIIQAGIKEIVYLSNKYADRPDNLASRRLLDMAHITYRQFRPRAEKLIIDLSCVCSNSSEGSTFPTPPSTPKMTL